MKIKLRSSKLHTLLFYGHYLIYCDILSWKDETLNWSLITILEEDIVIKEGLFPTPGKNVTVSQGGSKPKTEYQWMLAKALFEEHDKYKEAFSQVKTAAERSAWVLKIKNRLKR